MSISKKAAKREATKAARRKRRRSKKSGFELCSIGTPRGHDKSGSKKRSLVYYSDASAELLRGKPHKWPGLEFRPK